MYSGRFRLCLVLLVLFLAAGCRPAVKNTLSASSSESLLETGLYAEGSTSELGEGVRAYAPLYPLWSDALDKKRWIFLPEDSVIDVGDPDRWVFPVGTKFWKEFRVDGRIETRLMEKIEDYDDIESWRFVSFLWNEEGTDALAVARAGAMDVADTPVGTGHDVPSRVNCEKCHNRGGDGVLGFELVQLSGDGDGVRLADLRDANLLSDRTLADEDIPARSHLERQVMGYMHSNCGNCHNPAAAAGRQTSLDLRYVYGTSTVTELPAYFTSVGELTERYVVPGRTIGEDSLQVDPGYPHTSAAYLRVTSRDEEVAMPPMGSEAVDDTFAAMLSRWITNL